MKKILSFALIGAIFATFAGVSDGYAAKAKKQSAINIGTKVRGKVEAKGVYDQECYDAYYGCMDQFCIVDNEIGGSCNCSNEVQKYESALEEIKNMLSEAERIGTEEVEKVQAGANADIIFNGERKYDKNGNVIATKATKNKDDVKKSMWSTSSLYDTDEEDEEEATENSVDGKTGDALYSTANKICKAQMDEDCQGDLGVLVQMYSRQIVSDCKGLANSIEQKKGEAKAALAEANKAVRSALKESLEESNKYDRGTCMVEYKKCMRTEDACGEDWSNCVFTIASENMQNNKAKSTARTSVETIKTYDITASTMEILKSKRFICEKVLDSCVAVRDLIWDDFLREAAPTIRLAEQNVESEKRQSCLKDISDCIQKACKDDIEGKGVDTMDACLARPDMARSFCKIQIDPCERMEPQIWDYVVSKLASMRVDACTQEVKDCFTSEDRCGPDFMNCIGMDFNYIHDICPIDKLVVCKQANPDFKMSDLDEMLMGLYLNIDNQSLENCHKVAEEVMTELCQSTTNCDIFADDILGTSSIKSQKLDDVYRVTGMITFGSIKIGDAMGNVKDGGRVLKPGEIGVEDYMREVRKYAKNENIPNSAGIISSIEEELKNIAGTINRVITLVESNDKVQFCINGRDLSQIKGTGKKGKGKAEKTEARYPNLMSQYRVMIAMSALRKAQENYNKKITQEISNATKNSSADVAQYLCQKMASVRSGKTKTGGMPSISANTPLTPPYAISYDVSTGLTTDQLTSLEGHSEKKSTFGAGSGTNTVVDASFDRETRTCHICRTVTTVSCKTSSSRGGLFGNKRSSETDCPATTVGPTCEDVTM